MDDIIYKNLETPLGLLTVAADRHGLCSVTLPGGPMPGRAVDSLPWGAEEQLLEYFAGKRQAFALPLSLVGTAFSLRVWAACLNIPYGQTATYGDIARQLGRPGAARAVGGALHRNPLMILVPCHRVLGAGGGLTGYAGGVEVKDWLLRHEREHAGAV